MSTTPTPRIPTSTNEALVVFVQSHIGERFTRTDIKQFLAPYNFGTCMDTAMRALRILRSRKVINYTVVNQRTGVFQALPLKVESGSKDGIGGY